MAFFCINCKSPTDPNYKACPFCGEPITDFLRRHLENPIDGKYKMLSRLGIGGMGEVYKVLHLHLNAPRVVKLMRPSISNEEDAHDRFIREARLATRIQHPNVSTLFDFSTLSDGSYYMVWEYIEGMTLAELIRARGRLSPRYAAELAIQVLHGLEAIHRSGVVHRDISPENIMIAHDDEGNERVKIIDLGIAKQWSDTSDDKTKTGMFVGKWKYCSPEQLGTLKQGERIDARADLYSFAIVLYEMITGRPPFFADSPHRYLLLHATETPPPFSVSNPETDCPKEFEALIFRALEKDREKRFASARQFAASIEAILSQLPSSAKIGEQVKSRAVETVEHELLQSTVPTGELASAGQLVDTQNAATVVTMTSDVAPTVITEVGSQPGSSSPAEQTLVGFPAGAATPARSRNVMFIGAAVVAALVIIGAIVVPMTRKPASQPTAATNTTNASALVTPASATLALNAYPWGTLKEVRNVDNGSIIATSEVVTPATVAVPPGRYEVTITHPTLGDASKVVEVAAGENAALTIQISDPETQPIPSFSGGAQ